MNSNRSTIAKRRIAIVAAFLLGLLVPSKMALAADPPTQATKEDDIVRNLVTGKDVKVVELILDPPAAPGAPQLAFVRTDDGNVILVKNKVGDIVYNSDNPPLAFTVVSSNATTKVVQLRNMAGNVGNLSFAPTVSVFQAEFNSSGTPGASTPPVSEVSANGVAQVRTGTAGSNGRAGVFFIPPSDGGVGKTPAKLEFTNTTTVNTSTNHGIVAGSVGGAGGMGGNSYLNLWGGRKGGDGAKGGTVELTNANGVSVTTSGADKHGIFAYGISGKAGDGGLGWLAPGGGTGGHSSDGGNVEVTNEGNVTTSGKGAFGIFGQSVSNNGGNGGDQWGLVGKSGAGNFGGNGGVVSITNEATGIISTTGNFGHGIFAQSVGGSGGSSGVSGNLLLSLIGDSDNGGNGGAVTVTNQGLITTSGNDSKGIFAQSVGGGGGSGGSAGGLIAIGGAGSNGGSSGEVTVKNESAGTVTTTGIRSDGIFAQSVGGSGGGGSAAGGLVAIGGKGSKAGNGGDVTVTNSGSVSTSGDNSRGIVAQSIGGGGGDGGSSGGMVAVGGSGAGGGTSGKVTLTNGGNVTTKGVDSAGIYVQSVGGGGGNGGSSGSVSAFVGVAVGGTGGKGGAGGEVDLTFQGVNGSTASLIQTEKDRSVGVFAQSVGGGGGTGGGAVSVTGGIGGAASIAIGGSGGDGGAGGKVTLSKGTGKSNIITGGNDSTGFFMQSVGGGGGNGGYSVAVAVSGGPVSGSLSVAVGGGGAKGGNGGEVSVGSFNSTGTPTGSGFNGDITTTGDRSSGFIAQSVGGGGGNGGTAVSIAGSGSLLFSGSVGVSLGGKGDGGGTGGKVSVATEGNITTSGNNSTGMLVQSTGGGGGNGGGSIVAALAGSAGGAGSVNVGLGGAGGKASAGGNVTAATLSGKVTTNGQNSTGIIVQSVGGGGGNGGYSASVSGAGAGLGAGAISVGIGGTAGGGGNGGTVIADLKSDVETNQKNSSGILVQSVGGGGGNGGLNVSAAGSGAGVGSGTIAVGLGGKGGDGGLGGNVTAKSSGAIQTMEDSSSGFVVQSIGGGGGNGGFNISGSGSGAGVGSGSVAVGLGGAGGSGNHGGSVSANSSGTVTTMGSSSVGIIAQSVGGGGGNGGFNVAASGSGAGVGSGAVTVGLGGSGGSAGNGGTVNLTVSKKVTTSGNISGGIIAQSVGGGGGNGGLNVTPSGSGAGVGSGAISVGLGGSGAGGGMAGSVTASVTDDVETSGIQSGGILVQSIGGGGGNGGANINAAGSGAGVGSGAISVGIGGKGGTGGQSSSATLNSVGDVSTKGTESRGVVVQSIGGGGGNGGLTVDLAGSGAGVGSGAISVSVGGSGGDGGKSGKVVSNVTGDITTEGRNSDGFIAQSLGGGGGNGALNVTASGSGAGVGSGAISVGVGSSGGDGGDSNVVEADFNGALLTKMDYSVGFMAQAVGGGGGNAGGTISAAGSGAGVGSGTVTVGVGGSGGAAGDGGLAGVDLAVTAKAAGSIETRGAFSGGFIAQSIGGGGGNGGYSISANGSGAGTGSGAVAVGIGGGGAKGGIGKDVMSRVTGTIKTMGNDSIGMLTQSVGGGGGNGGFSVTASGSGAGVGSGSVAVGLGGGGDVGGKAGKVDASTTKSITTTGDRSTAFVAQSIGGGGGNGGFNVTATGSGAGTGSGAIAVGLGGKGKGGGNGGAVIASTGGTISTSGVSSGGVLAQSVGGGGGNGGFNVTVSGSGAGTGSGAINVGLGGSGAGGGNGSTVDLTVNNDVTTMKKDSTAVTAQSVGGGGGSGGFAVSLTGSGAGTGSGVVGVGLGGTGGGGGDSARVDNTMTGNISTGGASSTGLLVQSVGGGGGNGGFNVTAGFSGAGTGSGAATVGIGGSGGDGGNAGVVDSTLTGNVATTGKEASGVIVQSVGGGGGNGAFAISGAVSIGGTGSGAASVGIGGSGGGGGTGAAATSSVTGGVITMGEESIGIITQSVGGGGGNGGTTVTGAISMTKQNGGTVGVGVGGFGGGGGNAGDVSSTVRTTATNKQISTNGKDSDGVVAQSIGGGGGNGGTNVTASLSLSGQSGGALGVGVGGFGGGAGNGGKVTLDVAGDVVTKGDNSTGLIAQSVGGGGGNGGTNVSGSFALSNPANSMGTKVGSASVGVGGFGGMGGNAGDVDLDFNGSIDAVATTVEKGSDGLVAQSVGGGGGNGGVNVALGVSYAGNGDGHGLLVGVGGFGGDAGHAGNVDVDVAGGKTIKAAGDGRSAIIASSIGGGGGRGGLNVGGAVTSDSPIIVGVGGMGGKGGKAGNVTVNAAADLTITGSDDDKDNSGGLVAQSIGGGGGDGGLNVSGGLSLSKDSQVPSITFGIGGFGGSGATSGNVSATHSGVIDSTGRWTHGIFAQSIAGGGGNGALNVSGALNFSESESAKGGKDISIVAGLGGHGGAGADAGMTSVTSTGNITTKGDYSRGIFAQSVGGGGGTGGMNVTAIFAKNSSPITMGVGGFGAGGGHAGDVSVTRGTATTAAGKITTDGIGAIGIESSSIGGGGGDAGMNFVVGFSKSDDTATGGSGGTGGTTRPKPKHTGVDDKVFLNFDKVLDELEGRTSQTTTPPSSQKQSSFAAQIAVGGAGGDAGNGGKSTVMHYGDIETTKDYSRGILAQSIGGGGGNATLNLGLSVQDPSNKKNQKGLKIAVGGSPGEGGNGGKVDVLHRGKVETKGNNSTGILAQSVGGGGGNVGSDYALSKNAEGGEIGITIGRIGGTGGKGDDVKLDSDGMILTNGDVSYGLLAQSIGNGGGNSSTTAVGVSDLSENAPGTNISVGLEGGMGGSAGDIDLDAAGVVSTKGDDSHAIFGQSVGGGGGNGGSVSKNFYTATNAEVAVGGKGGMGGTGGKVDIDSSARVGTQKRNSIGILGQSIGGGGGNGGEVEAGGVQGDGSSASIAVGGNGGTGMMSGAVEIDNSGIITTAGEDSHGVLAQSIGGGGGNASSVINGIINTDSGKTTQISVSVGGAGGTGAESGKVTANNTGAIETTNKNSIGIFAQSIGGGGGNAGKVLSGVITSQGSGTAITLGIGGNGGTGGTGGDVEVSNKKTASAMSGQIVTRGDASHGIFATSIGGGGGMGSTVLTANSSLTGTAASKTKSVAFGLGGQGGTGETGGVVTVDNEGLILTFGKKAHGILAQSVGGGGGNGGVSVTGDLSAGGGSSKQNSTSIGGKGGTGSKGGKVTVSNSGTIQVNGNESSGIYAQSVGGGGGDGGFSTSLSRNVLTNPRTNLKGTLQNISVGGSGGTGGDGGDVRIENTGSVMANGDNSYGIFAQSVGGGGGNVGTSITNPIWMAADLLVNAITGGRDGADGKAGKVSLDTAGSVTTTGKNSQAYFSQAVSGGGGKTDLFLDVSKRAVALNGAGVELPANDGFADPKGAIVSFLKLGAEKVIDQFVQALDGVHSGTLATQGDQSVGSQTQSVGGGGGTTTANYMVNDQSTLNVNSNLGGTGTSNSSGGAVDLTRNGGVATMGKQSQGGSVQSIGGGGGRLVSAVDKVPSASPTPSLPAPARQVQNSPLPLGSSPAPLAAPVPAPLVVTSTTLGGDASVGSNGGDLNLNFVGNTVTVGDQSPGQVLQSIGAGGGESNLSGFDALTANIGATNGSSGNGGNISLTNTGAIRTSGVLSHGMVLQSIGGGGGLVISDTMEANITVNTRNGNTGNGGTIQYTQEGDVVVLNDRSIGILAQSLGGGGGAVDRVFLDTAGGMGSGGSIDLTLNGSVQATGNQGVGVFAQSRGGSGAGDIAVSLRQGEMLTFGAGGTGVVLSGGMDNVLTLRGDLMGVDGLAGQGVLGTEGNDTIENHAIFLGQFNLGAGANAFNNHGGGTLISGPQLSLGNAANILAQDGTLATGGMNNVQRTALMGSFRQSARGRTIGEIDFAPPKRGQIDGVDATGTVTLAGTYELSLLNPQLVPSGRFEAVLFHGDGGVVNQGLRLITAPSIAVTYQLLYPTGLDAILGYEVNFAPKTVGRNLQEVGNYINRIQAAGSSPALDDVVVKLLFDPDLETFANSLSQMSPDFYAEMQSELIRKSQVFNKALIQGGTYHPIEEDRYLWFRYDRDSKEHDGYDDYKRVFHNSDGYAFGFEQVFQDGWSGSLGGSFENGLSSGYDGRWRGESSSQQIGVSLKRTVESTRFGMSFAYGWDDSDVRRIGDLIGPFTTHLSREMNALGVLTHFSHEFEGNGNYIRPGVDLGFTRLMANAARESGAGPINLLLADYEEEHVWVEPEITVGRRGYAPFGNDLRLHVFANLSVHEYLSDPYTDVIAGLEGDSTGSALMRVPVELGQTELRTSLGAELTTLKNVSFGVQYTKSESEHNEEDRWSANLRVPF